MAIQLKEVAVPDPSTLSQKDRQALAQTRKYLGDIVSATNLDSPAFSPILVHTPRPDGKSKRAVSLGEEVDRRAEREAKDARRKRMHVRRPDGSKKWVRITPDRQLKAYEDIALETQESDPSAQTTIAEERYRASIGTATRHEVKRHIKAQVAQNGVENGVDPDGVLSLLAQEGAETVPIMVGRVKGLGPLQEIVSFSDLNEEASHSDPLEDPILEENNVDNALESFRRDRHVPARRLPTSSWFDYGQARQDH